MPYQLRVVRPLGGKQIGGLITDQDEINRILAPGHSHDVVKVWIDDPAPAAKAKAKPEPEPKADVAAK